ncbi:MAG: hypothetical protein KBD85_02400 [Elusimicrobia bacterium]|nr:hypothetical protein [Elusimicrobiota bacterium]
MPVDPQLAAQVRAQLWVKLTAGLKAEFDQGIDREGGSPYGPLTLLAFFGEGFGQKAFFDYAIESGQWNNFFGMVPAALKDHVSAVAEKVSPASSASPLGLLPLIGRPVYTFLVRFHVNRRLAAGIAGVAEQGVLVSLAGGMAWLLNWVFGIGFIWGLILSTSIIWKMFPKSHGSQVLVYENFSVLSGWCLRLVNVTDDHIRSLRQASHWFFGSFLVVTLIPVVLPLLGIAVPGSLDQWFFAGATISSLFHGVGNSINLSTGRVAALGGEDGADFQPPIGNHNPISKNLAIDIFPQRGSSQRSDHVSADIRRILLGGEAGTIIPATVLTVSIDALRKKVADDRQLLAQKRDAMVVSLGLGTDVSEESIAAVLARGHGGNSVDKKTVTEEITLFLTSSLVDLDGDTALEVVVSRVTQIVDAYHAAQGLFDSEKALTRAIVGGGEIALELTVPMVRGDVKLLTRQEKAQWDRLKRLAQAASRGELKKPVRLVIPEGITKAEVENALSLGGAGGLLKNISTKPKNELALAEGKYSLRRFVDWVRGDKEGKAGTIEMYLMFRNEWYWDNLVAEIQNNVRILVDVLPGLVMDATRGLPEGLKRLIVVNMSA